MKRDSALIQPIRSPLTPVPGLDDDDDDGKQSRKKKLNKAKNPSSKNGRGEDEDDCVELHNNPADPSSMVSMIEPVSL